MNLLFFGSSSRQLFGAYHAPPGKLAKRGAAVLCPPWGCEYLASHRILRRLATRLSENGYHVLRFDYYGTGDSAGRRDEGDLASWYQDAAMAVDELRDMSGCSTVATFGIRLGGVIGWRLAHTRDDVSTVVMWDPVVDGPAHVNELVAAQTEIDRSLLTPKPRAADTDDPILLGFPLTPAMRQSIEAIGPGDYQQPTGARVTVFYSDAAADDGRLHEAFARAGTRFRAETMPGQPPWRESRLIVSGGPSFLAVERMVEILI